MSADAPNVRQTNFCARVGARIHTNNNWPLRFTSGAILRPRIGGGGLLMVTG